MKESKVSSWSPAPSPATPADPLWDAVQFAERGFRLLPLYGIENGECKCPGLPDCHPGKHPLTDHGFQDASSALAQVLGWGKLFPGCNWGAAVSPETGIIVLDFDPRDGGDLAELVRELGPLPLTLEVLTGMQNGQRGRHLYFKRPAGELKNCDLAPGVQLIANGYVVCAGQHQSGDQYAANWAHGEIAELPANWLDYIRTKAIGKQSARASSFTSNPGANTIGSPQSPPPHDIGGNESAQLVPPGWASRVLAYWRGREIPRGQSIRAYRRLASALAYHSASEEEALWVARKVIATLVGSGGWLCVRSPDDFLTGTLEVYRELPRGPQEIFFYEAEIAYLLTLGMADRYFVYLAILWQRVAEQQGREHFFWPLKFVVKYMSLAPGEARTAEQLYERAKYLTAHVFNPQSRSYTSAQVPLFTAKVLGNHPQNPLYRKGERRTANEYRLGDDYRLADGQKVAQKQAEALLGVVDPMLVRAVADLRGELI